MNFKSPFRLDEIKFENIRYTKVKHLSDKTIIYTQYEHKNKLSNFVIQSPSLLNINLPEKSGSSYNLDIPLKGQNDNKTNLFIGFLNNLDRTIINDAKNNSSWFDNFIINDNMTFHKTIRDSDDYKNGMFRAKIVKTNDFESLIQINNTDKIKVSNIPKDSYVKMILEVYAIWVNSSGFGIFIRPVLISFKPIVKQVYNYKLLDDSSEEEDDVVNTEISNIFISQQDANNLNNDNNITSVLELPDMNNLSSTSSENMELE